MPNKWNDEEEEARRQKRAEAAERRRQNGQRSETWKEEGRQFLEAWHDNSEKHDYSKHWTQEHFAGPEALRAGRAKINQEEAYAEKLRKWNPHPLLTDPAYGDREKQEKWYRWWEQENGQKHPEEEKPPPCPDDPDFDRSAEAWDRWWAYENRKYEEDEAFEAQAWREQYGSEEDGDSWGQTEETEEMDQWWAPQETPTDPDRGAEQAMGGSEGAAGGSERAMGSPEGATTHEPPAELASL